MIGWNEYSHSQSPKFCTQIYFIFNRFLNQPNTISSSWYNQSFFFLKLNNEKCCWINLTTFWWVSDLNLPNSQSPQKCNYMRNIHFIFFGCSPTHILILVLIICTMPTWSEQSGRHKNGIIHKSTTYMMALLNPNTRLILCHFRCYFWLFIKTWQTSRCLQMRRTQMNSSIEFYCCRFNTEFHLSGSGEKADKSWLYYK